jgi:hypothetical protein
VRHELERRDQEQRAWAAALAQARRERSSAAARAGSGSGRVAPRAAVALGEALAAAERAAPAAALYE